MIVLLCASFSLGIGGETASLTVSNLTAHHVSVDVAGRTWTDVGPGGQVRYSTGNSGTVGVHVAYLPGQGVAGSVDRSFYVNAVAVAVHNDYTYFSCISGGHITTPIDEGMQWSVTPDTLATK